MNKLSVLSILLASVICSGRQVLNKTNSFGNLHLFFFCQLISRPCYIWGWVVHWHCFLLEIQIVIV